MQQWLRDIRLIIGLKQGETEALDFSKFRVKFNVKQAMVDTPASAEIYIYNLSKNTTDKLIGTGQSIVLEAGYEGGRGIIFKGTVRQLFRGRESQTDTFLCVLGQSSDLSRNYSVTNGTLSAGYDHTDLVNYAKQDMTKLGDLEDIQMPTLSPYKMPRGRAMFGMSRTYVSEVATTHGLSLAYVDNKIVGHTETVPVEEEKAVVLNSTTGMVGMPQLTVSGIYATCLLRADIRPGTQIQINESSIKRSLYDVAYAAEGSNFQIDEAHIDQDGYYRVVSIEHYGDTRGNDWYSQLCCIGINATSPLAGPSITAV